MKNNNKILLSCLLSSTFLISSNVLAQNDLTITNDTTQTTNKLIENELNNLTINNKNPLTTNATTIVTNNSIIKNNLTISNAGFTSIINNNTIDAKISDEDIGANNTTAKCLSTKLEIINNSNINNDIYIQNNKLLLTNNASINSNEVNARELYLNNIGTINSEIIVHNHIEANNSGIIDKEGSAITITSLDTTGVINNTGTISSNGVTIGIDETKAPEEIARSETIAYQNLCKNGSGCDTITDLTLNNSGLVISESSTGSNAPDENSIAIDAENLNVNNINGGTIAGSINAKNFNQDKDSTWQAHLNKDTTKMNTVTVAENINIEQGSNLYIKTNNDVKEFTNGQKFEVATADNMTDTEINNQLENFDITSDSPFSSYDVISENNKGYLVFNHVAGNTYSHATDLTTSNHNAIASGSHRTYELFVNRNLSPQYGLSSGDNPNYDNSLNFMPIGGFAHQGDKGEHAGYSTTYFGGIGYYEHDFTPNWKGGLGLSYVRNNNDLNDELNSDSKINTYRPFAYINYENCLFRADLALGYALHQVKDNRNYAFNNNSYTAKSKYDAQEFSGHLNLGYKMLDINGATIQPMAGLYLANIQTDSFTEKGNGPMNMRVKSDDYNSAKTMLGVKISEDYELKNHGTITPEIHLRWYHEMGDRNGGVTSYFLAQEDLFNASGIESPKDIGDVALRITTSSGTNYDLFAEGYYQFGNEFYNTGGSIGVQYNFN